MEDTTQTVVVKQKCTNPPKAYRTINEIRPDSLGSWYVLGILTIAYALAFIDRQLLNLVVDPIRHSLAISDTQVSFVQGIAFASAYLLAAPLFGRLADVTNRRNILVAGIAMWSVFTTLSGRADTYFELLSMRFGVGASEACVFPVACSLIPDFFSEKRTPRALSIFLLGPLLGGGLSLVAGGLVIELASKARAALPILANLETWKLAFVLTGVPGLALAGVVLLSVREPARSHSSKSEVDDRRYPLREATIFLWQRRAFYGRMYIGLGMLAIVFLGLPAWYPAFLIRFYGVAPAIAGFRFGLLVIVFGGAGVLIGPWLATFVKVWAYKDAPLRMAACSMIGMLVCSSVITLPSNSVIALAIGAGAVFCFSLPSAVMASTIQLATPSRIRGLAGSLYVLIGQVIGYGLGPTSIALVTDKVFHRPQAVGYSISIVCAVASLAGAWLMFSVLPHYRKMRDEKLFPPNLA